MSCCLFKQSTVRTLKLLLFLFLLGIQSLKKILKNNHKSTHNAIGITYVHGVVFVRRKYKFSAFYTVALSDSASIFIHV